MKLINNLKCCLILFLSLIIFSPAFCEKTRAFKNETIKLNAAGVKIEIEIFKDNDGNIYIPMNSTEAGKLFSLFSCRPTYLAPMQSIVLGFSNSKDSRIFIGKKEAEIGGVKTNLKTAPYMLEESPIIPLEALEKAFKVRTGYDPETKAYFMDPVITEVGIKEIKGKIKLIIKSSAPLKYETSVLENPKRYVIDIPGGILETGISDKDFHHPQVGSLFVSQEQYNPNKARIVVPLDKGIELEMIDTPTEKNNIEAWLFIPYSRSPVTGLKEERVTNLRFTQKSDRLLFTVVTTGPVQYEWRRLLPPDNRFFVDIPGTVYTAPIFDKNFDNGYIENVKVFQYRGQPEPTVRVAFQLSVPSKVSVSPHPKYPQEIQIEVLAETINPKRIERQGFGLTYQALKGLIICIDPGHGGGDPGACNSSMGLREKELTLDIALKLASKLRKAGWNVIMTRTTDRDVSYAGSSDARELGDRVKIPNDIGANLFVSIHINASVSSSADGTSVHYYKGDSEPLARQIHDNLVSANGRRSVGVIHDSFYVIRNTNMPAVLVECAFISNPTEASLLSNPSFRERCAEGIFNGISSYAAERKFAVSVPNSGENEEDESNNSREIETKKKEIDKRINRSKPSGSSDYGEK